MSKLANGSWAAAELESLDLGDARRKARIIGMVEQMAQRPSGSIAETFRGAAEAKAAYRALSSEAVDPEALRAAAREACVGRMAAGGLVLAVQDTTALDYTDHPATEGRGPLVQRYRWGMWAHSVLSVSADGVPLGLVHQRVWARDPETVGRRRERKSRPVEEKESYRWIESLRAVHAVVPAEVTVVTVADRESDLFAFLAEPRPANSELLLRAAQDRRVRDEGGRLWAAAQAQPVSASWVLALREGRERPAREARVELRYGGVTLQPPRGSQAPPVTLTAILVREVAPPAGARGIEWLLLTTLPVREADDARQCVQWYACRWLIERYHYVLKSGCRLEQSQLRSVERLQRLLALYCLVAWRLLWLTYAARLAPDTPCTVAFAPLEWQAAHRARHPQQPLPDPPPALREVVRWIAELGGFLGRRGDGEPGVKVLWRGLMRLHDIIYGMTLASPIPLVGNG